MAVSNSTSAGRPTGSIDAARATNAPEVFRILDWTKLDTLPSMADIRRLISLGGGQGGVRLAILVNTPRKLRAATVIAEQAAIEGAQVRVFVDAKEAMGWLYKDMPPGLVYPV